MAVKTPPPVLTAKQMENLANELCSTLLMKAADEQYLKEQQLMQHKIGKVTLKVIDGQFYHYRPHGWIKISKLTDIVFEEVQELPINGRMRSLYPVRIECGDEAHKVNVSIPIRTDLTDVVLNERMTSALAAAFGGYESVVYIRRRDTVLRFEVSSNGDVVSTGPSGIEPTELGGITVDLEI